MAKYNTKKYLRKKSMKKKGGKSLKKKGGGFFDFNWFKPETKEMCIEKCNKKYPDSSPQSTVSNEIAQSEGYGQQGGRTKKTKK